MASFGQVRSSSGRQLDFTPEGWINNEGVNLNAAPQQVLRSDGRLTQLAPSQGPDLSSFLEANGASMRDLVDYNGKKAFRVADGYVWQNPDGSTGKATIVNPQQAARDKMLFDQQKAQAEFENLKARTAGLQNKQPSAPSGYRYTTSGALEPIPGGPADQKAATGPKLTEEQGKATSWLVQAGHAFENMEKARQRDPSSALPGLPDAIEAIPSMGLGRSLANTMRGTERQKFMQGAASLSEALLHAATGAGFSKEEAEQKVREVTPVFGESPETTQQKMAAIPLYLDALRVRAGPGAAKGDELLGTKPPPPSSIEHQQTLFNAKKAIARNPAAREQILQKLQAAGYSTGGL